MFAFAFYHNEPQELWIGRDSQGIKPLFIYESEKYTLISSEIKGILATELFDHKINQSQLLKTLQLKHPVRPETIFYAINEVEPGTCIEVFSGSRIQFEPVTSNAGNSTLKHIWEDEVKAQLVSEKPIGILLSGGIDSALILAAMCELGYKDIPTFSISNNASELRQIAKVSNSFKSNHQNYPIEPTWDDWISFINHLDQPIGDSGAFLTYLLSEKASSEIGVALSGAGADEYFAGYNRHLAFRYYKMGGAALRKLAALGRASSMTSLLGKEYARLGSKFLSAVDDNPRQTYSNFVSTLPADPVPVNSLEDALEYDRKQYLISDVLAISDMMSMAHGLELRVPFLGQNVVDYATSKTADELTKKGRKWMLKELLV
jgi:asparagine synthase (glutamine-hydrolysing)